MRLWVFLFCFVCACPKEPKEPTPEPGPFLVVFRPWVSAKETTEPTATSFQIAKIEQEVFQGKGVMFDEAALNLAKKFDGCNDLPCAAEVARSVNATWFLTGQLMAFPPAHCFVFFSARSFENGAEILGYNPEEVEKSKVSQEKADFALKSEKLKKCDDAAFYEQVRKTLRTMSEDPGLRLGLKK
jgi:hypothetical protein